MSTEPPIAYFRRVTFTSRLSVEECVNRLRATVDCLAEESGARPPAAYVGVALPDTVEIYVRPRMLDLLRPGFFGSFCTTGSGAQLTGYFGVHGMLAMPLVWPVGFAVALGGLCWYAAGSPGVVVVSLLGGLCYVLAVGLCLLVGRSDVSRLHQFINQTIEATPPDPVLNGQPGLGGVPQLSRDADQPNR